MLKTARGKVRSLVNSDKNVQSDIDNYAGGCRKEHRIPKTGIEARGGGFTHRGFNPMSNRQVVEADG